MQASRNLSGVGIGRGNILVGGRVSSVKKRGGSGGLEEERGGAVDLGIDGWC